MISPKSSSNCRQRKHYCHNISSLNQEDYTNLPKDIIMTKKLRRVTCFFKRGFIIHADKKTNIYHKNKFYQLLFKKRSYNGLKITLSNELRRLSYHDQISILWSTSFMKRHKKNNLQVKTHINYPRY